MNVVIINKSDATGGAAVVSFRLMNALRNRGINANMLVVEKTSDSPYVHIAASPSAIKRTFIAERLKIFLTKGVTRSNLFKLDTASDGLPLYRNQLVKEADIICLNWINQGMLSLKGLEKLIELGKPIVWTMHDMWCFTGICHHAGSCRHFLQQCGMCPLLSTGAAPKDLSNRILIKKQKVYSSSKSLKIHFVAVSNWLAQLAKKSTLLKDAPISVIPNAFPIPDAQNNTGHSTSDNSLSPFSILFGAARLDDPIKGLPILIEATRILKKKYPSVAANVRLVTFGNVKNPDTLSGIEISHRHLGVVKGEEAVAKIYHDADAVISSSLYETLPGTLVEGQVYGCIPIAFDRGGQSDIIDHLSTGYLARWDDDIKSAAENLVEGIVWAAQQDKNKIKEKMYRSAFEKFESSIIADKYIYLFNKLLTDPR